MKGKSLVRASGARTARKAAVPRGSTAKRATATPGAYRGGRGGRYVFDLFDLDRVAAGGVDGALGGYADTRAAVVEGERVQVGLAFEKRGCGSAPHTHPNEQFNFIVKGNFIVDIGRRKGLRARPGSVVYIPANVVHSSFATPDEDAIFFVVKDLSHGITGTAVPAKKRRPAPRKR